VGFAFSVRTANTVRTSPSLSLSRTSRKDFCTLESARRPTSAAAVIRFAGYFALQQLRRKERRRALLLFIITMAEKDDIVEMKDANAIGSEEESDVELEGVDMEDDVVVEEESATMMVESPAAKELDEDSATALAAEEAAEMEAARKERLELLKAEMTEEDAKQPPVDAQSRLDYLLHQSDVFAHFLAGSVAATNAKSNKGGKGRGKGLGRLTEEEEDAQLLKSAQSKRRVVRLDHSPACLAPHCKMHPYQLEGLNWLIKLHDHGINAILADGTCVPETENCAIAGLRF
jgi:hypothetical protein